MQIKKYIKRQKICKNIKKIENWLKSVGCGVNSKNLSKWKTSISYEKLCFINKIILNITEDIKGVILEPYKNFL